MVSRRELDVGVKITDEAIATIRRRIGLELRPGLQPNEVATKDNIKKWAWGIGDNNPLWLDEEYARKTKWGGIIAPPTFLCTFGQGRAAQGLPGLHGLWSEDHWEFSRPVRLNDVITYKARLVEVTEKPSRHAGRAIEQVCENVYRNQRDELVAIYRQVVRRYERATSKEKGKLSAITRYHYTEKEIQAIEEDCDKEEIRGAVPRYWEGVKVGDELAPIVKGPLTVTDMMAFCRGGFPSPFICGAHRRQLDYRRRHPRAATLNPYGIPDVVERVHWEDEFAQEVGVPAAFDYGWQRVAWAANLITNWMGDEGFLKKLDVQLRRPNFLGDTTWYKGKVANKFIEGGDHLVKCEFWAYDQRGETTTLGSAMVLLPSRGA